MAMLVKNAKKRQMEKIPNIAIPPTLRTTFSIMVIGNLVIGDWAIGAGSIVLMRWRVANRVQV